jgi:hypothetical protein
MTFRKLIRTLPAVLLLAVTGCAPEDVARPADTDARTPNVPVGDLVHANAVREPDRDDLPVLHRLAEPRHIERETQPNRHRPAEADTFYTYRYDGLDLDFMRTFEGKEIILAVEITHERYPTPHDVRIGMAREEVRSVLGEPVESGPDVDRYTIAIDDVGPEELLEVRYRDSRVESILYGFFVD